MEDMPSERIGPNLQIPGHGSVPGCTTTYLGRVFHYPSGNILGDHIARGHEWDDIFRITLPALLTIAEPHVCEIGSNIGASLLQVLAAKPRARVIALEPCDLFRAYLERNLASAGYTEIEILPLLAGPEEGHAYLHYDLSSGSPAESGQYTHRQPAAMTTLDALLGSRPPVDFVKIDTDGYDFEVLRGGEAILHRDRPILHFEFTPALMKSDPAADLNWLRSLGYQRLACLHPDGRLAEVTEDPAAAIGWAGEFGYCDLLACPAGSEAEHRLERLIARRGILTLAENRRNSAPDPRWTRRLVKLLRF